MNKGRIEAFSDGVIAVIITIMVLEFKVPKEVSLEALLELIPHFVIYSLSFVLVGIYWNNHHHLFHLTKTVNGSIMWANLHLLFWLSLMPFATAWVGSTSFAPIPIIAFGVVQLLAGASYFILSLRLLAHNGPESSIAKALGSDFKGRVSVVLYLMGIGLTFVHPWIGLGVYILVAAVWFIPDPRFEKAHHASGSGGMEP